jgi:hypothetical protein
MASKGHREMAQRSEVEIEECAAEQARDLHETVAFLETFGGVVVVVDLPSQRIHSKGEHGNQTRSEPVSM